MRQRIILENLNKIFWALFLIPLLFSAVFIANGATASPKMDYFIFTAVALFLSISAVGGLLIFALREVKKK